jgi:Kef-type K+ transport system membrane component KefB
MIIGTRDVRKQARERARGGIHMISATRFAAAGDTLIAMGKVVAYSILLVLGMIGSQLAPRLFADADALGTFEYVRQWLTFICLAFIMIHVGYEFDIDKRRKGQYGTDFAIAMTAATFPWLLVAGYFVVVMGEPGAASSWNVWKEELLVACFAAPTSAGVLFSMLAAAGLATTWLFKKARVLAIFDDIGTILLLIPLKMFIVGLQWQLGVVVVIMVGLLLLAWFKLHAFKIPISWPFVVGYSIALVAASEGLYVLSKWVDPNATIHMEILLPAFVLGCVIALPRRSDGSVDHTHPEGKSSEAMVGTIISGLFLFLVGLSLPHLDKIQAAQIGAGVVGAEVGVKEPMAINWMTVGLHVLAVTFLSNLGKMFPAFCYKREASFKTRLALAIGMWPRGEVGAGILVVALSYGIAGETVLVAVISLALNLVLTGVFIVIVKRLIKGEPQLA